MGTSMPTMERPGTGASIRMGEAARAKARSLARAVILLTRTFLRCTSSPAPAVSMYPGLTPNWVTAGPWLISTTFAGTPKLASVCSMILARRCVSSWLKAWVEGELRRSKGGKLTLRLLADRGLSLFSGLTWRCGWAAETAVSGSGSATMISVGCSTSSGDGGASAVVEASP